MSCHPKTRSSEGSRPKVLVFVLAVLFLAVVTFAAPKSASAYYSDAAFQYIENRLPSAEITCNEGLQYYPNDQKLQMLLDRIHEAKDEQKNENKKNDKNQDNQDKNQDQDQNQDQNKDGQDQNKDQDQNGSGQSSSSQNEDSASSSDDGNGGVGEQPEQPQENSSDSAGSSDSNDGSNGSSEQEQPVQMGEMSPEDAAQLLKDFDEQNGERKPWKPLRGQARPAKDW